MAGAQAILAEFRPQLDLTDYRKLHWEGSFEEYLNVVLETPGVTRSAYQRLYDMVISHGTEEVYENKEKVTRYTFFTQYGGKYGDGIFGMDRPLSQLVNTFKSAAKGYGTERRVLLLHGPVGSAKSTIARLLKRGMEEYSRTDAGMLFSYSWKMDDGTWAKCPMHQDPLCLIPPELRPQFLQKLNASAKKPHDYEIAIRGELNPFCRQMMRERLAKHNGDWYKVLDEIKVSRLLMSEQDRIGIGTFQPKDEKNQDSTELTGDINYRKIAEYGTDSDPRCVVGSTLLATAEGLRPAGALLPFTPEPDTFTPRPLAVSSIGGAKVAHSDSVYYAGPKETLTLRTRLGYKLTASPNHMVLVMTPAGEPAWAQLREVKPGDHVALGRGVHTWPETDALAMSPAEVRGIGQQLRDGGPNATAPDTVLRSSRESVLAFLDGLGVRAGATFTTESATLARQVHLLLLATGTVAALSESDGAWSVGTADGNGLPHVMPRLREIGQRAMNREAASAHCGVESDDIVSYRIAEQFLALVHPCPDDGTEVERLQKLVAERHAWLPVEAVEAGESAEVFDLSVTPTHAFWADGFICHNCFNFDGELNIANRGIVEFIEILKLDVAFLYDLLTASQEHKIKPKKFAQTDIDEVILGHTNEPEYKRLQNNEFMEALRDRTVKIDIPYNTRLADEIKIYEKDFNPEKVKGKHIAPHTIEIAAMWAVLTRLVQPKHANLTLLQKLKLYNGKTLPGFTEDNVIELKREAANEGMTGISPRYIQDKISNALVAHSDEDNINPFMVMHELETGLRHHSLINQQDTINHYRELLGVVKEEYEDIVKNEVQRAIAADEDALMRLCGNYIDNVKAYTQREKVRNRYTGNYEEPDERLMRAVEEKIDIPDGRKDDFRREIMNYIGALAIDGKKFDYKTNERLQKALELKLFEDQKDTIKLTSLVSNVVDKATQEKIDIVKQRLIRNSGYNESSATDVLNFVASIFARGQTKK